MRRAHLHTPAAPTLPRGCASPAADTRPAAPPRRQLTPLRIIFHTLQGVVESWGGTDNPPLPQFHATLCGGRCGCGETRRNRAKWAIWVSEMPKTGTYLARQLANSRNTQFELGIHELAKHLRRWPGRSAEKGIKGRSDDISRRLCASLRSRSLLSKASQRLWP